MVWMSKKNTALVPPTSKADRREQRIEQLNMNVRASQPEAITDAEGAVIEEVSSFPYLGRVVHSSGDDQHTLKHRMSIARQTMRSLTNQGLRRMQAKTRLIVWKTVVRAQVAYGAGSWSLTKQSRKQLDSFQLVWLRRYTGNKPKWNASAGRVDYPKSTAVYKAAKAMRLSDEVDCERLRLLGHILRRGENDPVARSFTDGFQLPYIPGLTGNLSLRGQLRTLLEVAELNPADAWQRGGWRVSVEAFAETRKKAAQGIVA